MKRLGDKIWILCVFALALSVGACTNKNEKAEADGASIEMKYADLLKMTECEGYVYAEVSDPWDSTRILHSYVLVDKNAELPSNLPKGDVVRVPISNAVVYTSVHCGLIHQLGAYDCIKGVCDLKYIKLEQLQIDCKTGKVKNLGEGTNPSIEGVIDMQPDAVLLSPFQNSGTYGKLGKLGIPIIECADYMETSALGRAEWMKFYGLLVGRTMEADTTFAGIEKRYNELKAMASGKLSRSALNESEKLSRSALNESEKNPTVITDLKFGSTWYVPGGQSTIGRLLADAGGDYVFATTQESGSIPLDPEVVFDKAIDADIWVVKYNQATDKTYIEIEQEYANYANMAAFKNHNIYGCNTGKTQFYEETPFHPDLLLKDYIKIFHPESLPGYEMRYYKKISNE